MIIPPKPAKLRGFDFDFKIPTALKGWVGRAPQGRGALHIIRRWLWAGCPPYKYNTNENINERRFIIMMMARRFKWLAVMVLLMITAVAQAQQSSHYFTGDGGKDIRLAVLEPAGKGLSEDDKWMLPLIQGSISGDFNKYSSMTIIDRQNLEKVLGEWEQSMSGNYSDADRAKIGNLTNASHILTGGVTKTASAFMIEFYVTDVQSGTRKASYSPKAVSLLALEDLSAVKEASADLLGQLGVSLTGAGIGELKRVESAAKIQAETMLARGISAQKQGTEVAALSYFFQAAILDPSLAEAVNRSSVMAANVSSGNIGEDARNDVAWRKSWVKRLEEAEQYIDRLNKTVSMPYTLFYSDEIIKGDINYQKETMPITIKTNLYGNSSIKVWARSVEKALQAVYEGLEATGRKKVWSLYWPSNRITELGAFRDQKKEFNIVVELVNSQNKVIGKREFEVSGRWSYNTYDRPKVNVDSDTRKEIRFESVNVNDITDNLTIRFATVNDVDAVTAAKKGILQIKAMRKSEFDANDLYTFKFGEISEYKWGTDVDLNVDIPATIWDDAVISIGENVFSRSYRTGKLVGVTIPNGLTSIGKNAFHSNKLTSVTIPNGVVYIGSNAFSSNELTSVTIPDGVVSIGSSAFSGNKLTSVTIPNSVTFIENSTFEYNELTRIVIGEKVTIEHSDYSPAFGKFSGEFEKIYGSNGRQAGSYYRTSTDNSGTWNRTAPMQRGAPGGNTAQTFTGTQSEPERPTYTYSGSDESSERPTYSDGGSGGIGESSPERPGYKNDVNNEKAMASKGVFYGGIGGLLMMEQADPPIYEPFNFNVSFGLGIRAVRYFHLGASFDIATKVKLNEETFYFYPEILEKADKIKFYKYGLFARLYLGKTVFVSGGAGIWSHSEIKVDDIPMFNSETEFLYSLGFGSILYADEYFGLVFDVQYNILPENASLNKYLTFNVGCHWGHGVTKKTNTKQ